MNLSKLVDFPFRSSGIALLNEFIVLYLCANGKGFLTVNKLNIKIDYSSMHHIGLQILDVLVHKKLVYFRYFINVSFKLS